MEISLSQGQHKQHKYTQTFMPLVEFVPTSTGFERAKTVHASDCTANVTGKNHEYENNYFMYISATVKSNGKVCNRAIEWLFGSNFGRMYVIVG
jgi:hypothetical protein